MDEANTPRYEVHRKAMRDESNDTRVGDLDTTDIPSYEYPYHRRSPFPIPTKYDFDDLEAAKDVLFHKASAADLMGSDYYILKITEDSIEVAYGDPTVTAGGRDRT